MCGFTINNIRNILLLAKRIDETLYKKSHCTIKQEFLLPQQGSFCAHYKNPCLWSLLGKADSSLAANIIHVQYTQHKNTKVLKFSGINQLPVYDVYDKLETENIHTTAKHKVLLDTSTSKC